MKSSNELRYGRRRFKIPKMICQEMKMFRSIKSLMHTTHETQAANRNEPGAYLNACARKGYTYLNKHHKDKKKSRAYLDQYLVSGDGNGDGVLIHIRGLAQQEIDKINNTPGLTFEQKLDLQEKPRKIQELVIEAFLRKQARENEAAALRPSIK